MVRVTNILHTARIGMSKCGICALKGNAMEYFKPDEQMRMMYSSVSDTDKLGKRLKIRVLLSGVKPKTFQLLVRVLCH